MVDRPARGTSNTLSQDHLRAALDRILLSQSFSNSPRSSQFLRYVVNESLARRGSDLNEYAIGLDVFGRASSFDPRTDTIVRVQARRMRKGLADYYANEGSSEPITIEVPKGSYAPRFRLSSQNRPSGMQGFFAAIVDRRRSALLIGVAGGLIAFVALVLRWPEFPGGVLASSWGESTPDQADAQSESPISVPLTAFGGHEREPDLSPDGESVAFLWDGELLNNHDVYVKPVGGDELVRLTDDPAPECCPSWSPDGRRIAFLRPRQTGAELILVPASGGPEHTLGRLSTVGHKLCWSPNGEYLAVEDRRPGEARRIFLVSSATGEKRPVTNPPAGISDRWPAFSPDGRTLAFARGNHQFAVYTVALAQDGAPAAKPERVIRESYSLGGLDWTPDGRDLVFGAYTEEVGWRLWKVRAGMKGTRPAPLPMRGWQPSFARRPPGSETRLAYVATFDDKNIYRVAGPEARETTPSAEPAPERIVGSSRTDTAPRLSPAADKVVFVSGRSGHSEVWTADADGSNPLQITWSERSEVGSPSWSPDGRLIAFNGMPEDNIDVYVVEAGGGVPRRLTIAPSNEGGASWSRDGGWIYFMSDQTGRPEIWKMPSEGGRAQQVTRNGGHQAVESPDGTWLYYSKSIKRPGAPESLPGEGAPGVFRVPVAGGEEEQVLEEGVYGRWALSRSGIYHLRSAAKGRMPSIEWFRYETWERMTLKTFPRNARFGMANSLTVSLDDRWIVFAKYDHTASDLMLVDGFRGSW